MTPKLYDELAHLWTLVSDPADYAKAAAYWCDSIRGRLGPGRHRVLELGVGGGHNLSHLTADFDATAVDLSEKMLAESIRLNPTVEHLVGDMRTVRLGRLFDAVLVHDAISHMTNEEDVRAVLATAAAHLRTGGVLVMAPDFLVETFAEGTEGPTTRSSAETTLTVFEYTWDPDPRDTTYECIMVFLIREPEGVRVVEDRLTLGLFPRRSWLDWMEAAGFTSETDEYPVHRDGRTGYLLVGVKRPIPL